MLISSLQLLLKSRMTERFFTDNKLTSLWRGFLSAGVLAYVPSRYYITSRFLARLWQCPVWLLGSVTNCLGMDWADGGKTSDCRPLPPYRGKRGIFNDTDLDARPWRSEESQLGLRIFPS